MLSLAMISCAANCSPKGDRPVDTVTSRSGSRCVAPVDPDNECGGDVDRSLSGEKTLRDRYCADIHALCATEDQIDLLQSYYTCLRTQFAAEPDVWENSVWAYDGIVLLQRPSAHSVPDGSVIRMGAISIDGRLLIPFIWNYIEPFYGGTARACRDCVIRKYGEHYSVAGQDWVYINRRGEAVSSNSETTTSPNSK